MDRMKTILSLCLLGALLTSCQYTGKQAFAPKVIPLKKTAPEKIIHNNARQEKKQSTEKPEKIEVPEKKAQTEEEAPEKPIEIAVIVSYFRFLNSLPEKALKQEHTRTQKEFAEDGSTINRLRLAILLGFAKTKHRDTQASLDLLNHDLENLTSLDPMLRDFSYLLATFVQKFKKQDKAYKTLKQQLNKERAENKKLKKMIEALKTIEKNLVAPEMTEKK
ncbi:MAG: hypothetical protein GXO96_06975 [Nitrospirae bacterium]|nr:hypothetical protein [Candidatus Manganitrophaceae bacterium]